MTASLRSLLDILPHEPVIPVEVSGTILDLRNVIKNSQEGNEVTYPVCEYIRNNIGAITRNTRGSGIIEPDRYVI